MNAVYSIFMLALVVSLSSSLKVSSVDSAKVLTQPEDLQNKTEEDQVDFSCPFNEADIKELNIHVIPHSHQDPGWLQTFDDYFYGTHSDECVKCIYDTLFKTLKEDKTKKKTFVIVEISFFEKWYSLLNDQEKEDFKKIVKEERVEFVNGGWVMNDEATSSYDDILLQFRKGYKFLNKEFGISNIETAWSIDPFGHSATHAYLLRKLGFENVVMTRIDYREKEKRIKSNDLEFYWEPYNDDTMPKSKSKNEDIFVHLTSKHYSPEREGFGEYLKVSEVDKFEYYEYLGEFNRKQRENKEESTFTTRALTMEEYQIFSNTPSIKQSIFKIYQYFLEISKGYKTNELMFLFGDDFTFKQSAITYGNMDKIIEEFQTNKCFKGKVKINYSTPKRYFQSLKINSKKEDFEVMKGGDFFPYADGEEIYWTGYFTSRPAMKGSVKENSYYLKLFSEFKALSLIFGKNDFEGFPSTMKLLDRMQKELSLSQHHDAVAGTARENVSQDYIKRMSYVSEVLKKIMIYLLTNQEINSNNDKASVEKKEISILQKIDSKLCRVSSVFDNECNNIVITRAEEKTELVSSITFIRFTQKSIILAKIKVEQNIEIEKIVNIGNKDEVEYKKYCYDVFDYCDVYVVIDFKQTYSVSLALHQKLVKNPLKKTQVISHQPVVSFLQKEESYVEISSTPDYVVKYGKKSNKLLFKPRKQKTEKKTIELEVFHAYYGYDLIKDKSGKNREGAYLFGTDDSTNNYTPYRIENVDIINDPENNYSIVIIKFENSFLKMKFLRKETTKEDFPRFEVESVLEPLKMENSQVGLDFILVIKSNLKNTIKTAESKIPDSTKKEDKTIFYTDSNGLKTVERVKNHRNNWEFVVDKEIESNFYPSTAFAYISDKEQKPDSMSKLSVFVDRSQAVSSLRQGELQFILNRISLNDDNKGLAGGIFEEFSQDESGFEIKHMIYLSKGDTIDEISEHNKIIGESFLALYSSETVDNKLAIEIEHNAKQITAYKTLTEKYQRECFEMTFNYLDVDKKNEFFLEILNDRKPGNSNKLCNVNLILDNLKKISGDKLSIKEYDMKCLNKKNNIKLSEKLEYLDMRVYKIKRNS